MLKTIYTYRLQSMPFFLLITGLLTIRLLLVFSYSVDLDGLEYYFVHIIQQRFQDNPMYANPSAFPYSVNLYTPVYLYLLNGVVHLCRFNIYNDLHGILVAGRILSLIIVLLQLLYLKKFLSKFISPGFQFLVILSLYLLLITGHMYAVRPDSLKILFFIVFLYYLTEYLFFSFKLSHAILSISSAVLAVYSKQDIAIYITLCFVVLLFLERSKKIFFMFLAFLSTSTILFIACLLFYGKYFIANIILFNIQSVTDFSGSYNLFFILLGIAKTSPLIILAILNCRKIYTAEKVYAVEKFISIIAVIFYPFTFLSMLRPGANLNYTYELSVVLMLNIAVFISMNKDRIADKRKLFIVLLSGYAVFLLSSDLLMNNYYFDKKREVSYKTEYAACLKERDALKGMIGSDTLFFPNTKYSIFYADKNVVLGHDMHLDRFINLYTPVHIQSKLPFVSTAEYDSNFKNGKIKYILINDDKKSVQHVAYFYPSYSLFQKTGDLLIYRFSK